MAGPLIRACRLKFDELRPEAGKLKDLPDRTKDRVTEDFRRILEPYRKPPLSDDGLRAAFIDGLARRVGAKPDVLTQVPLWFTGPDPDSRVIGTVDVAGLRSGPRLPRKVGPAGPLVEPSKMSEGYPPFRLSGPERVRQLFP